MKDDIEIICLDMSYDPLKTNRPVCDNLKKVEALSCDHTNLSLGIVFWGSVGVQRHEKVIFIIFFSDIFNLPTI